MEYFYLGLALLLVLANGFFVASEFAIVKLRPTRVRALIEEGRPGAKNALKLVNQLDGYLSATQFGITLASLGLGWLGEPAFHHIISGVVGRYLPEAQNTERLVHTISVAMSFAIITFLHIVIGELAPKSLAIQKAEATTLFVAWPMRIFYIIFYPAIWVLNSMAGRVLRLFGLRPTSETEDAHSEEELRVILHSSAEAGAITSGRAELLGRALEMLEKTARQVMVPRNQVMFLDVEEPLEKCVADARLGGHTWLPVCRGGIDSVEGVVNVKDLFFLLSRGELRSLAQVQRSVLFVPENVTLEQLLSEFRRRKRQLAVVVDEHGGTSGIVTLADVVAEVVGDVAELGRKVEEVTALPGGTLEVPGSTQLDDLEDRLDVSFENDDGDITTIAGYLMMRLGRIPSAGDRVTVGDYVVTVQLVEGPRVLKVRIEPKTPVGPPAGVPPSAAN